MSKGDITKALLQAGFQRTDSTMYMDKLEHHKCQFIAYSTEGCITLEEKPSAGHCAEQNEQCMDFPIETTSQIRGLLALLKI